MPQPNLGTKLRALRSDRGNSIAEVSDATGISASFLSLVENGRSDIAIGRLMRLIDFYGVGLATLRQNWLAVVHKEYRYRTRARRELPFEILHRDQALDKVQLEPHRTWDVVLHWIQRTLQL